MASQKESYPEVCLACEVQQVLVVCNRPDRGRGARALVHLCEEVEDIHLRSASSSRFVFCSRTNNARYYSLPHQLRWSLLQEVVGRREIGGI